MLFSADCSPGWRVPLCTRPSCTASSPAATSTRWPSACCSAA